MTEDEARDWLATQFDVPRGTRAKIEKFVALLLNEADQQNLIADSTRDHIWARHIVDSAQLLKLVPPPTPGRDRWIDLGAGAGLPGMIIAILSGYRVTMIEMRRKRIEFLEEAISHLGLSHAAVIGGKVEQARIAGKAAVISARAYAPMERLIPSALHLADFSTVWLLPKGRNYENELDIARTLWHSDARVEHSLTAPESAILVLENVRRKSGKRG